MSQVGAAPWDTLRRRTIRGDVNPLDKSTIVSIYPVDINETKPTLQPGKWHIPAGSYEKPSILVIGPSSWWRELGDDEPLLEIPVSSIVMADSIIKDFANGIIESNMNDIMPGLFFIPGAKTLDQIRKDHAPALEKARVKQDNWFKALVKVADTYWARTNGNPLSVSDDMRLAAKALGLKKDWMLDTATLEMIKCKACGHLNNSAIVVCPNCKVVLDAVKFKELGLTFAQ